MAVTKATSHVSPEAVHGTLGQHMLVDGYPVVLDLEKSHGPFLYDSLRGRQILDFFASFSTSPLGYNHPGFQSPELEKRTLRAAIHKPANSDLYTTEMAEFVASFARIVPENLAHHLFFIEGGALAVENAIKAAFDWKVKKNLRGGTGEKGSQVIHFRECFHGRSGYTLSMTNTDPGKTQYFPKFSWPRVTNPKLSFPLTDEVLERVIAMEQHALDEIKQALIDHRDDIAALIIEPIQGEGGDNHFRGEFLQQLRELADEEEFLLIFDEVQTGFATTGRWWCFEHFGVEPDIFAFGKKTQVCGIAASRRLDEVDSVFQVSSRINSTWGGNLVDMIRCQRVIEIIEEDDLLANAARVGGRFLAGLRELAESFSQTVGNARGRGMFVAVDLPDGETRGRVLRALYECDILGLASGVRSVRFRPPVNVRAEEVDEGVRRIEQAFRKVL